MDRPKGRTKIRPVPDASPTPNRLHVADTAPLDAPDAETIRDVGLDRALHVWQEAAGSRDVPAWRDVDLLKLPASLRRGTMVADYDTARDDFFIRYWGDDLVNAFGIELSQKWLSEADHNGVMTSFRNSAHTTLERRAPQWLSHAITSPGGIRRVFPVVRLPLIDPDTGEAHVMTVENIEMSMAFFAANDLRYRAR